MNIFKWLGKSGKIALSTAQAVGLSAVIGVAGIAAWQYLDAPSDNTAFNLGGQYNPGEVVYVAGANGGSYGANGEVQSSFLATPSKAIEMTEKMALAQKQAEEYEEAAANQALAPSDPQAYQMGGTEGLGMGANRANEEDLKNNPMAFAKQSLSGVSDAIANAQAQAQQAAAAGGQAQGAAPAGTLASASRDWGSSAATKGGSGGGNAFNSSFVVQDSSKKGGKGSGAAGKNQTPEQIMKNFQSQVASAQENARLRARASFGQDEMLASDKNLKALDARSSREKSDLAFIRKRSADAAANRNRAANEAARAWLASEEVSGGMSSISGETVTTGQGQGSKDFNDATETQLRGIRNYSTADFEADALKRKQDRDNIRMWMWIAIPTALAAMVAIPAAIASAGWLFGSGWIFAAAIAAVALIPVMFLLITSAKYATTYSGSSLSTWGMVIGGVLTAGLGIAFIPGVGFSAKWATWAQLLLGGGAAGLGALGAWWATSGTKDETLDSDSLNIDGEQNDK